MERIIALYHSGVGNTRKISEKIVNQLQGKFEVSLYSIERLPSDIDINSFSAVIIGFPTIHTHPSKRIMVFLESIEKLTCPKPTYIFTTCGLYSANTLRIFAKLCITKNLIPVIHRVFNHCPATDGVLLAPYIKAFFTFDKNLNAKIDSDCLNFISKVNNGDCKLNMPRFKIYSILNYPNKLAGHLITFPIHLHKNKCVKCSKCVENCPAKALDLDVNKYPLFISKKCEKCYRCIHHCPSKALSLSSKKTPKYTLK